MPSVVKRSTRDCGRIAVQSVGIANVRFAGSAVAVGVGEAVGSAVAGVGWASSAEHPASAMRSATAIGRTASDFDEPIGAPSR